MRPCRRIVKSSKMTETELDFLEFMSEQMHCTQKKTKLDYLKARKQFHIPSSKYVTFIRNQTRSYKYNPRTAEGLIDLYKFSELWCLYVYLSYSYQPNTMQEFSRIAKNIIENSVQPIIIDYGCGLGYISFEIGRLRHYSEIFLVDVDNLVLKFANFRFVKHSIKVNLIRIDKKRVYPLLPEHDVCILFEVLEHVKEPLRVCENIISSLRPNGLLCGNFQDHRANPFHVSPNLHPIRKWVALNFKKIGKFLYQKK